MSSDSDTSFADSEYYDVDYSTYYNETEDFSDEIQVEAKEKSLAAKSDIQDACSTIEGLKCTESNADEPHEDLSNVTHAIEIADSITNITDLLDSSNEGNANFYRKSDLFMDNISNTYECDEMNDNYTLHSDNSDEKSKQKEETNLNKFTPKTLNKLRRLLVDERHSSGEHEFFIGDLLHAIESELMKLPKKKKKVVKKSRENITIKPKQKKLKVLSRYAIRSMALKRNYHMQNKEILASSISKEFIQLDGMIEYYRQVNADFEAEFNQPNTPLGEANLASQRMDDVFTKFTDRIPALQECYKEVKHCLSLYVKSDKTLRDDLLKNINKYFVNSRVKDVLSVQYGDILEAFQKSNRLHFIF